jgi:cyclic pyranopterin phosphate synthase
VKSSLPKSLLTDRFARVHRSLRISVTDKCNLRCQYCMPDEQIKFLPSDELLSFEEIAGFVSICVTRGFHKFRITGGEPLLRRNVERLVALLNAIEGVENLAITTNGILLEEQLDGLVAAGLKRINISLDTLRAPVFRRLARRDGLERVLAGIAAAVNSRQVIVKLNALVLRDVNLDDVLELASYAAALNVPLRFIEFMPLDAERAWSEQRMVSGAELRELLAKELGPLRRIATVDEAQPATDYVTANGARFGFIDTVTAPFCGACDRLRLTADGKMRNCLFGQEEWDVRRILRNAAAKPHEIHELLEAAVSAKHFSHGTPQANLAHPARAMYQIGG